MRFGFCGCTLIAIFTAASMNTLAQAPIQALHQQTPSQSIEIKDLSQKFLDFYEAAIKENATPDRRWQLWTEKYGFAAVPPIPAGQKMAREQLDAAWARYPAALDRIRLGAQALTPRPQQRLEAVTALLQTTTPVHIRLITFVGTFRRNAFAMGMKDGVPTIAIPLEDSDLNHALDMTHEFTHAVQMQMGQWSGQTTVASAIFTEGFAMHATEKLNPGHGPEIYTTSSPQWMESCTTRLSQVLADLQSHLGEEGAQAVSKFTFAKGSAGIEREVYCAGWYIIGDLQKQGRSFHDLASLNRQAASELVAKEVQSMQANSSK